VAIVRRRCRPASRTPAWWFVIAPRVCPNNIEGIPDCHVVLISAGHTIFGRPRLSVACANWRLGTTVCGGHFTRNCQVYAIECGVTAGLGGFILSLCVNDGVWAQPAMWWLNKPSNASCFGGPFNHRGLLPTHLSCRRKEATRWFPWSAGSAPLVVAFSTDTKGAGSNCHRARPTPTAAEATSAR